MPQDLRSWVSTDRSDIEACAERVQENATMGQIGQQNYHVIKKAFKCSLFTTLMSESKWKKTEHNSNQEPRNL